jgi:hypothetical protein
MSSLVVQRKLLTARRKSIAVLAAMLLFAAGPMLKSCDGENLNLGQGSASVPVSASQ